MKIGHIVQNARCGHSYLSKQFVDVFKKEHEVFLLTTMGVKEDIPDFWKEYETTHIPANYIQVGGFLSEIIEWIEKKELDALFVQEWYDWGILENIKSRFPNLKLINYTDWFSKETIPYFQVFDLNIISAEHTFEVFKDHKNAVYVPWGVDTELFKPQEGEFDFFHNAGWGGINTRKCTPQVIRAFDKVGGTMFLHTQTNVFDHETIRLIKKHRGVDMGVYFGAVPHPGFYNKGKVYVGVSKLEGLGLYLYEALASGLPLITTDAPPMNQLVREEYNGLLVKVKGYKQRADGYYFPEYEIDQKDLEKKMKWCLDNPDRVREMSLAARKFIEDNHSLEQFSGEFLGLLKEL